MQEWMQEAGLMRVAPSANLFPAKRGIIKTTAVPIGNIYSYRKVGG